MLAEDILQEARDHVAISTRPMTYDDYNMFKHKLEENGHYGYEAHLATILKL